MESRLREVGHVHIDKPGNSQFPNARLAGKSGVPFIDSETLHEIGSISKVFTSLLLADAVESGQLKLDDPEVAKRLEGKYQLAPGIVMTVQVRSGQVRSGMGWDGMGWDGMGWAYDASASLRLRPPNPSLEP